MKKQKTNKHFKRSFKMPIQNSKLTCPLFISEQLTTCTFYMLTQLVNLLL